MDMDGLATMVLTGEQKQRAPGGDFLRLRRDAYVRVDEWGQLDDRQRHVVRMYEVSGRSDDLPLICGWSAAAFWGLPVIGRWLDQVEVMVPDGAPGTRPGIKRRRSSTVPEGVEHSGLLLTPVARTVVDMARWSPETGVAAADHALRTGLVEHDQLREEALSIPPTAPGRALACAAIAIADPLAETAGESMSRFRQWQLGFPRPQLQVTFRDAQGFIGRTDEFWESARLIGEFDGRVKYAISPGLAHEEATRRLWEEKRREDRLRRVVDGVARWTWREAWEAEPMRAILAGHGLRPSSVHWFDPVTLLRCD